MYKNILVLLLLIFINSAITQDLSKSTKQGVEAVKNDSLLKNEQLRSDSISKNQTLLRHTGSISIESEDEKTFFVIILPSLIALFVSFIALLGNIHIGKKQIQSAKDTLEKQIKSSKEIANRQIDTMFSTAELEFRQNVLSNNRQSWINQLRDIISEAVTLIEFGVLKE